MCSAHKVFYGDAIVVFLLSRSKVTIHYMGNLTLYVTMCKLFRGSRAVAICVLLDFLVPELSSVWFFYVIDVSYWYSGIHGVIYFCEITESIFYVVNIILCYVGVSLNWLLVTKRIAKHSSFLLLLWQGKIILETTTNLIVLIVLKILFFSRLTKLRKLAKVIWNAWKLKMDFTLALFKKMCTYFWCVEVVPSIIARE